MCSVYVYTCVMTGCMCAKSYRIQQSRIQLISMACKVVVAVYHSSPCWMLVLSVSSWNAYTFKGKKAFAFESHESVMYVLVFVHILTFSHMCVHSCISLFCEPSCVFAMMYFVRYFIFISSCWNIFSLVVHMK